MLATATNALYSTLRRRGTTRQLARAIVVCALSAVLLLPAIIWFDMRFNVKQALLPGLEVGIILGYVAVCGWVLPLATTVSFCLFSLQRSVTASLHLPQVQKPRSPSLATTPTLDLPRYQQGVQAPFIFSEDTPWGWLEYRSGNFQGQRLALKRAVATLGRDEGCDIWLDDEMASRHHAELAWHEGSVYLTDCESLNGLQLNGRRVHGSTQLNTGDQIEIGALRFAFILAEPKDALNDLYDPLTNHTWRSTQELSPDSPRTAAMQATGPATETHDPLLNRQWKEIPALDPDTPPSPKPFTPLPFTRSLGGPTPLKLPSRIKE